MAAVTDVVLGTSDIERCYGYGYGKCSPGIDYVTLSSAMVCFAGLDKMGVEVVFISERWLRNACFPPSLSDICLKLQRNFSFRK